MNQTTHRFLIACWILDYLRLSWNMMDYLSLGDKVGTLVWCKKGKVSRLEAAPRANFAECTQEPS